MELLPSPNHSYVKDFKLAPYWVPTIGFWLGLGFHTWPIHPVSGRIDPPEDGLNVIAARREENQIGDQVNWWTLHGSIPPWCRGVFP